uniref:Uncharacterized protein n=1 Tax=Galaxaura rugosa TaxID=268570 RepID=A0A1G4NSV7_9FLOR|nr:Hypothetical protein ORF_4 [Galaxaura rugosa]SCW21740.1 Hypothetical protein ORF_4 [Galaxaura rugosa]
MIQPIILFLFYIDAKILSNHSFLDNFHNQVQKNYYKLLYVEPIFKSLPVLNAVERLKSQEIIIHGINSYYLREKLIDLLNINKYKNQIASKDNIEQWVQAMKLSGFFNNVKFELFTDHSHQIVYIYVSPNPLLKTINIVGYKAKLIPSSYISYIFKEQIGKPINFLTLDEALKLIKKWYLDRGYSWTNIYVQYKNKEYNSITINIIEGIISHIDIIGFSQEKSINKIITDNTILEIIQVKPGYILNKHMLDKAISKLKQKKIALQCHYEVKYNTQISGTFRLIIHLEISNHRSTYIFGKALSISSNILDSVELSLYSLARDIILYKELYYNRIRNITSIINNNYTRSINRSITVDMSENDLNIYSFLFKANKHNEDYIYLHELYFNPILCIIDDALGFKHYVKHLGLYNSNFLINVRLSKAGPYLNLKHEILYIKLFKEFISQFYYGYFQGIDKYHYTPLPILLDQKHDNLLYYKNAILHKRGLFLGIKHEIKQLLYIAQQVNWHILIFERRLLQNNIRWTDLYRIHNLNFSVINTTSNFRQKSIQAFYGFFKLKIKFLYNYFYINPTHSFINCESTHFVPRTMIYLRKFIRISSNCTNKVIITIKKNIYLKKHWLLFHTKLINLIGSVNYLPYSEELLIITPQIIRGYSQETLDFPSRFAKFTVEYNVPIKKQHNFLLFIDYTINKSNNNVFKDYCVLLDNLTELQAKTWSTRISYGVGCQITIPFQQIPPLRFEYGYNIHHGQFLHLRINK